MEKRRNVVLFCVSLVLFFVLFYVGLQLANYLNKPEENVFPANVCGDGTEFNSCSKIGPYFCEEGNLVENRVDCNCTELMYIYNDTCYFKYKNYPQEISLPYVLDGQEEELKFTVYGEMADYLSRVPRTIDNLEGEEKPTRFDFKIMSLDEPNQRQLLLPLVIAIQNITNDKDDQVRIATSIVQHIEYSKSEKILSFGGGPVEYSRYPYEVLYYQQGICGEKSALLTFILREMGYGTAFLYYPLENHEAVGIKCPLEESLGETGYCYIETTGPAIIGDDSIEFVGGIRLNSQPQVITISEGNSLGENMYEYEDAKLMKKMREGKFVLGKERKFQELKDRYGLVEVYQV